MAVFHSEMEFAWKSGRSVKAGGMRGNASRPLTDSTLHKLPTVLSACSRSPILADRVECCCYYWHPCDEKRGSWVTVPISQLTELRNWGPEKAN